MSLRKITSMTMFVSLFVLIINSIVLYVVPQGRVAYWADWHFWGLSKTQWGEQHITVGFLFLASSLLHLYYNWNPVLAYMKNKARELKVFTPSFSIAFLLTLFFVAGTYYPIPPMSTILEFGEGFKERASVKYGEPPYGHAELSSLKMFANKERLNLEKSIQILRDKGLKVQGKEEVMKSIAKNNGLTPQGVYELIKEAREKSTSPSPPSGRVVLPDHPSPGFGKKSLKAVCQEYNLDVQEIVSGLKKQNIEATPEQAIKEIAAGNSREPSQIYEAIYSVVME